MGYSTEFKGELKFTKDITVKCLTKVKTFLGKDCREHPEWGELGLTYIDLELLEDLSGLKWDDSEKTYDLVEKVNLVIRETKKEFPDFGLEGTLLAQGEDISDRWQLVIIDGLATKLEIKLSGKPICCPNCGNDFMLEE